MMRKSKAVNFDSSWGDILLVTEAVINEKHVHSDQWCDQISAVYYLCMAMPDPLADTLYQHVKQYLTEHVAKCREEITASGENIIPKYHTMYKVYSRGAEYLDNLYMHLNAHFTKRTIKNEWSDHYMHSIEKVKKHLKIQHLALNIWRDEMLNMIHPVLVKTILQDITRDRAGVSLYPNLLRDVIHSFVEVQAHEEHVPLILYQELFESCLLCDTGEYYTKEAQRLYEKNDVSSYMVKVIEKLDEEDLRLRKFIHHSSISLCKRECENKLIADHQDSLLEEYKSMLRDEEVEDLSRLYKLIRRLDQGLKKMSDSFHDHVYDNGKSSIDLMIQGVPPQEYVDSLLHVYKKFSNIVTKHLNSDEVFTIALDRALTKVVNTTSDPKKPPKSSELLVRHADHILKKGNKNLTSAELDEKLKNFIDLFKFIEDKDLFQKFYSRKLATRLIHNLSVSREMEETAINGLKDRCGYEYTSPLQRMIIDMKLSTDLTKEFDEYLKSMYSKLGQAMISRPPKLFFNTPTKAKSEKLSISFSVNVLQSGAWPFTVEKQGTSNGFVVPKDLATSIELFKTFYGQKFSGRRLTFIYNLSNGTVSLGFTPRQYTITMTAHQLSIILMFNSETSYTFKDIMEANGFEKKELERILGTLVESKLLETVPEPDSGDLGLVYKLNEGYSSRKSKFKLPSGTQREQQEKEVEQTHHSVDEDRRLYIQAAIVRCMKSRKKLGHNELIQQVINQSKERFTPQVSMIKKCVEVLIDKQYLERDATNKDEYRYLA